MVVKLGKTYDILYTLLYKKLLQLRALRVS